MTLLVAAKATIRQYFLFTAGLGLSQDAGLATALPWQQHYSPCQPIHDPDMNRRFPKKQSARASSQP
jgi:hypothetical protein